MINSIQESVQIGASYFGLAMDCASVLTVTFGGFEALLAVIPRVAFRGLDPLKTGREIWMRFASWTLLSLEFALGADIIDTAISPTWDDIGKLAAIAAIRTFLNHFLMQDVEEAAKIGRSSSKA